MANAEVKVSVRFVNNYCKTRMISVVLRIILAIISGYVAIQQSVIHGGIFAPICLYWAVLFSLNMYEIGLVLVDIERQKKAFLDALKTAAEERKAEIDELSGKP